jgi:hypothetical protein
LPAEIRDSRHHFAVPVTVNNLPPTESASNGTAYLFVAGTDLASKCHLHELRVQDSDNLKESKPNKNHLCTMKIIHNTLYYIMLID